MSMPSAPQLQPVNGGLHPRVYEIMVGLTVWLVLSVWLFFNRGGYVGLTLAVVTLFFFIFVAIPVLLWLAWRGAAAPEETQAPNEPFPEWASHGFDTWTERLTGKAAAIQILLPLAAVAFGMTIFGLVFYFDVPTVG